MTREGVNILMLTFFILIGAVLRDVNLMVILAGALVGMLILQWRLAFRTLLGLKITRRIPTTLNSRKSTIVEVRCVNPRNWLGVWFLNIRDVVYRIDRNGKKLGDGYSNTLCVPVVHPLSSRPITYDCTFLQRGAYRFGPMRMSTRFPFSLLEASFQQFDEVDCLVHPAMGEIMPGWRDLFESRRLGSQRTKSQSGANDGEFFGLRSYRIGDSPRWIHWRSSARRSELVVRQFERQENIQACILLDLQLDPKLPEEELSKKLEDLETAIEFVASFVHLIVGRGRGSVSVSIAGDRPVVFPRIQSRNQVEALLNELSYAQPISDPNWMDAVESLAGQLRNHPMLVVVSTRSNQWEGRPKLSNYTNEMILQRSAVRWVDVVQGDLQPYFRRGEQ